MLKSLRYWYLVPAAAISVIAGVLPGMALPASAASLACQAAAPGCHSYNLPILGGMDLDASNWGVNPQTGTSYNDPVVVYAQSLAARASDFTEVPVTSLDAPALPAGDAGSFLIEYAPRDVPSGFCVSTITDIQGAYARLRNCALATASATPAHSGFNPWQTFTSVPNGDGFAELQAYGNDLKTCDSAGCTVIPGEHPNLNDRAWGGNGTPVISYRATAGENQLWEING